MEELTGTAQPVAHTDDLAAMAAQCEVMAMPSTVPSSVLQGDPSISAQHNSDSGTQFNKLPDTLRGQIRTLYQSLEQCEGAPGAGKDVAPNQVADMFVDTDSPTGTDATGVVLAVKQGTEDGGEGLEGMRNMLAVFGPIEDIKNLAPPPGNPNCQLVLFKYTSHLDAQHAVSAIGSSSRTSFSLHLVNHRGDVVRANAPSTRTSSGRAPDPTVAGDVMTRRSSSASTPTHKTDSTSASTSMALNYDFLHDTHLAATAGHAATAQPRAPVFSSASQPPVSQLDQQFSSLPSSRGAASVLPPSLTPVTTSPFDPANLQYLLSAGPFSNQTRAGLLGLLSQAPGGAGGASGGGAVGFSGRPSQVPSPPAGNADYLTAFDPNEAARDGPCARTTIMIRNIPCRWTAQDLLTVLSSVIGDTWDLLYMPCKNSDVAHAGYAFMNFKTAPDTLNLYAVMHGRSWPNTRSSKICEIRYARIQGRHLLSHLFAADTQGAPSAAFRGYLAFPAHGSVVVHGPEAGAARSQGKRGRGGSRKGGGRRAAAAAPTPVPHPADILGGAGGMHGGSQWMLPQGMHGGQQWLPAQAQGPGRLSRGLSAGVPGLGLGDPNAMAAALRAAGSMYSQGAPSLQSEPSYNEDPGQAFHLQSMLSALAQSMDQRQVPDLPMHMGS